MGLRKSQLSVEGLIGVGIVVEVVVVSAVVANNQQQQPLPRPDIRELNIQTYPKANGRDARCISNGGSQLFSVLSPPPVHGRTSSPPSLGNEGPASSTILQIQIRNLTSKM